jgi:hypothetical protein
VRRKTTLLIVLRGLTALLLGTGSWARKTSSAIAFVTGFGALGLLFEKDDMSNYCQSLIKHTKLAGAGRQISTALDAATPSTQRIEKD